MTVKHEHRREKGQRGGAMVEGALVLTIFVFLLLGIFDFSQFLFLHQALVERARYAARWGIVNDPTNVTAIQNVVLYGQPTTGSTTYFGLKPDNVIVTNPGSGTDDYRLLVKVNDYRYPIISPYIAGTYRGPNITVSVPLGQ